MLVNRNGEGASQLALAYIIKKGSLNANFNSERNFADILTRCSSLLQGESNENTCYFIAMHITTHHNAHKRTSREVRGHRAN